ncbi:MAG: FAD-dependent oxidoreductase [Planctomycetota bacterium]
MSGTIEDRFRDPETTTLKALQVAGFSASMIERFFRPFLGGIFLDHELQTSSRMFHFVFRMFSLGSACLPARGMGEIPQQLASMLPSGAVRLGATVVRVQPGSVTLETGEEIKARSIVVAVGGAGGSRTLG